VCTEDDILNFSYGYCRYRHHEVSFLKRGRVCPSLIVGYILTLTVGYILTLNVGYILTY
jgi:hypothetical protein